MSVTMPALPQVHTVRDQRVAQSRVARWYNDTWLLSVILLAAALSTVAMYYVMKNHLALLFVDAHAHLQIARRVFDSQATGLAQLGGIWLPLPHVVMFPFIMFDSLWSTGLAGAIPAGIAYVIASGQIFAMTRRLTQDAAASFVAALIFMTNPNILYMQSTPLSELILIATLTTSCYFFIKWVQSDQVVDLVAAGFSTFLATLARYDGWSLYIILLFAIVVIGLQKRYAISKIWGTLLVFGSAGGFGIALWFIWNAALFGDALYFQRSIYSSQAQQLQYINANVDPAYHNIGQAFRHYTVLSVQTAGPILCVLAVLGMIAFLVRKKFSPEALAALTLWVPFVFYVVALYTGQAIIFTYDATPKSFLAPIPLYNVRYGVMIIAPVAVFAGALVARFNIGKLILLWAVGVQVYLIATGGIITLQEGEFGVSCYHFSSVPAFFATHYNGGLIMNDPFFNQQDFSNVPIPLKALVTQSTPAKWEQAITNPSSVVDWVIARPGDLVSQNLQLQSDAFTSKFAMAYQDPVTNVTVYLRKGAPYVQDRAIDQSLLTNYNDQCIRRNLN